jgi:nicotinamide-nucleotide amidase
MPAVNRKQGLVPRGATVIENVQGTAPGLVLEHDGRVLVLLPGPPRELQPMMEHLVAGALGARVGPARLFRSALSITGRTESHVEEATQPIYSKWR